MHPNQQRRLINEYIQGDPELQAAVSAMNRNRGRFQDIGEHHQRVSECFNKLCQCFQQKKTIAHALHNLAQFRGGGTFTPESIANELGTTSERVNGLLEAIGDDRLQSAVSYRLFR